MLDQQDFYTWARKRAVIKDVGSLSRLAVACDVVPSTITRALKEKRRWEMLNPATKIAMAGQLDVTVDTLERKSRLITESGGVVV